MGLPKEKLKRNQFYDRIFHHSLYKENNTALLQRCDGKFQSRWTSW